MAREKYQWRPYAQGTRLMREFLLRMLQPGDLLIYSGTGWISRLIKFKTSSEWTHAAVYIGGGMVREFRENHGPQEVPFETKNLGEIRRPRCAWDREKSDLLWKEVKEWEYDYWGLIRSFYGRKQNVANKKMWCSEYAAADCFRATGCRPVSDETPFDAIAPKDLSQSLAYETKWMAKDGHL